MEIKLLLLLMCVLISFEIEKRALQKSHEKPSIIKWTERILGNKFRNYSENYSINQLLIVITEKHLVMCSTVIFYQENFDYLMNNLLGNYPNTFSFGLIDNEYQILNMNLYSNIDNKCQNFLFFLNDITHTYKILKQKNYNTITIVTYSSQWKIHEFLTSIESQRIIHLLIISINDRATIKNQKIPYNLYTHKLYLDGTGSSKPRILASWFKNSFLRNLSSPFPKKITHGFSKHRFIVSLGHQPPFVLKKFDEFTGKVSWDGVEIRLLKLLSEIYNFSIEFQQINTYSEFKGQTETILLNVQKSLANIGAMGIYITENSIDNVDFSTTYFQDCAAFISMKSLSISKYRAVFGPFQWSVWLSVTLIYMIAVFLLSFSDNHNFTYLFKKPQEIENMFWYVFGTFTNSFTFSSNTSWNQSNKISPRLLIASYWIFSIVITSCYTGSIIAFITIPTLPSTTDTLDQLIDGYFRIGTLNHGGWQNWFKNFTDQKAKKLVSNLEYVQTLEEGVQNITKAFFRNYAFIGSRESFSFIIQSNFTQKRKKRMLHISSQCLVPFSIGLAFPKYSIYKDVLNKGILQLVENGLLQKIKRDVEWSILRSPTGSRLEVTFEGIKKLKPRDRIINVDDTKGMFLLLAMGLITATIIFVAEFFGGCFNIFKGSRSNSGFSSDHSSSKMSRSQNSSSKTIYNIDDLKNACSSMLEAPTIEIDNISMDI